MRLLEAHAKKKKKKIDAAPVPSAHVDGNNGEGQGHRQWRDRGVFQGCAWGMLDSPVGPTHWSFILLSEKCKPSACSNVRNAVKEII